MKKNWEELERERKRKHEENRCRYLAMSDFDAESLPVSERYERIRFLREKEAADWLENERRKLPTTSVEDQKPTKTRYYGKQKIVYDRD